MSVPIKVDDLVMVVKWPCCGGCLGAIATVAAITPEPICSSYCLGCKAEHRGYGVAIKVRGGGFIPAPWVRRIPPIDELEGEQRREESPA